MSREPSDISEYNRLAEALCERFESGLSEQYGTEIATQELWLTAIELALHPDNRIAFRASHALEWAYFSDRNSFRPYVKSFLDHFLIITNRSAHRHYAKMMCDMVRCGIIALDADDAERVAEKAFDMLIDPRSRVAVKVWAMEILADLSTDIEWIAQELPAVVEQQAEALPTPAMINYTTKLLKRLARSSR